MSAEGKLGKRKLARVEQWVGEPLWHAFARHPWVEFVTPDDRHGVLMPKAPDPASTIEWRDEDEICHWNTCPVGPPPRASSTPHYDVWRSHGAEYVFPDAEIAATPDLSTAVCPVCQKVIHGDSVSDALARYGVHFIEAANAEKMQEAGGGPDDQPDIVDRLRAEACGGISCPHDYCEMHDEAADEIERLRALLDLTAEDGTP